MEKPNIIEKRYYKHKFYYVIRFNIKYDESVNDWVFNEVKLPYGKFDYSTIINALIEFKYPNDKMQAIINNYLLDSDNLNAIDEFNQMQEWRKFAKSYAKEIIN